MIILSRLSSPSPSAKGSTSNADRRSRWALLAKPAIGVALAMGVFTVGQAQAMVVNLGGQDWNVTPFTGTFNENTIYAIINNSVTPPTSENAAPVVGGDLNQPETNLFVVRDQDLSGCPAQFESCQRGGTTSSRDDEFWERFWGRFCMINARSSACFNRNAASVIFGPPTAYSTFLTAGSFTPSTFTIFTLSTSQATPVPGPLPALGAAAAFGFSRKLRKRIKRSSDADSSTYSL